MKVSLGAKGDHGPADHASFAQLETVAVVPNDDIYVGDSIGRIRKIDAQTGIITTMAGSGWRVTRAMAARPRKPASARQRPSALIERAISTLSGPRLSCRRGQGGWAGDHHDGGWLRTGRFFTRWDTGAGRSAQFSLWVGRFQRGCCLRRGFPEQPGQASHAGWDVRDSSGQ